MFGEDLAWYDWLWMGPVLAFLAFVLLGLAISGIVAVGISVGGFVSIILWPFHYVWNRLRS